MSDSEIPVVVNKPVRESNFELLRIVAMFFILLYHLIGYFALPMQPDANFLKAIRFVFHIGVLLFIFISGYFGVRPSVRGGGKLLLMTVFYFIPVQIVFDILHHQSSIETLKDCLVLSYGPYWFISTYFLFYWLSPLVNKFLETSSTKSRLYMMVVFAIINIWFGRFTEGVEGLFDGKNILNFMFLYIIGSNLKYFEPQINRIKTLTILIAYLSYNIAVVLVYAQFHTGGIGKIVSRLCYGYNSPGLIFSAICLFLLFGRICIKSTKINFIASSVFSVYLITDQTVIRNYILKPIVERVIEPVGQSQLAIFVLLVVTSVVVMTACIVVDKMLSPVWRMINCLPRKIRECKLCD